MNIKKEFKTGNTTNSLVSHNILTNHTFNFQNSDIFAFIHSKNKRIIEACSIETPQHNTTTTSVFFKISRSIGKMILKEFKIHTKDKLPFL